MFSTTRCSHASAATRSVMPTNGPLCSAQYWYESRAPAVPSATEAIAVYQLKLIGTMWGNSQVGCTYFSKLVSEPAGMLTRPTTTDTAARTMSGTVMTFGDSCGVPCPRYSPKKVIHQQRIM